MSQPVTIENEHLRLEIWPQFGGKISSMIDKADGHELLFTLPTELPTRCQYGFAYADGWPAGWDECFPARAPGAYPLHPYEGILVPDHGELWPLPTTSVPTRDGITTVWHGLRFGYRLTRKLYLEAASVIAEYTLINLAPFDFRFAWTPQILLSARSPAQIDLGAPTRLHGGLDWPAIDEHNAYDLLENLPGGCAWRVHAQSSIRHPATLRYVNRNRLLSIEFGSESGIDAFWTVALNTGESTGQRNLSVAPTTARCDDLAGSVNDASAATLPASARTNWRLTLRTEPS